MNKYLSALAIAVALSGCSSSGSDDDGTTGGTTTTGGATTATGTTGGTTTTGTTTASGATTGAGATDGGPVTPSGTIAGAWFGTNNFGDGVMIVDANQNVFALAANGSGQYETVFGPASEQLQRFVHRDSDNPAFADSFTLAGEPPSKLTASAAGDLITYNLATINDGQEISNTGTGNDFTMTFATENDLAPISLDLITGDWAAKTSFCAVDCNLTLSMTFTADGGVTGFTLFNEDGLSPLEGAVTVAPGSTQHLNISFIWTEKNRRGVLHFDRNQPTHLVLNTFGPADEAGESRSFTARMIRQ